MSRGLSSRATWRVLSPEHVEIVLEPAGPAARFCALVIDVLLIAALVITFRRLVGSALPGGVGAAVVATFAFVINAGYHVYFETRHQGRSLGKMVMGLRVVDGRGLPVTLAQSFVRNVVRALDFLPFGYGGGTLVALADRHRRRLGDLVADTLVIQDRAAWGKVRARFAPLVAELGGPANTRRLRQGLSLPEREFLLTLVQRAPQLGESARFDLMAEVGGTYRRRFHLDLPHLSDENLVRALASLLSDRNEPSEPR